MQIKQRYQFTSMRLAKNPQVWQGGHVDWYDYFGE